MPYILDNDIFFAALYEGHAAHESARTWLDGIKPEGWGIAMETYLAAMRLLMNPAIMGTSTLDGALALKVVRTELSGVYPGAIIYAKQPVDPQIFSRATGHRQIMDFWLVQMARDHGRILATRDRALHHHWPEWTFLL